MCWLRPDYQNAEGRTAQSKGEQAAMEIGPTVAAEKAPWPRSLPEQIAAVRAALSDLWWSRHWCARGRTVADIDREPGEALDAFTARAMAGTSGGPWGSYRRAQGVQLGGCAQTTRLIFPYKSAC